MSKSEWKQLREELRLKEVDLKRLKQELLQSESTFQKSLSNISAESSNAAVELASLKAMLQVEQSKVAKLQSESSTKVTSAEAKWKIEQRKAETLEARLVEAEVIHQEQLSEITEFLEARRHELQLDDIDFSKLRQPSMPNAANEVERLKTALAEEQARVSSAERKLVKGWSDQRSIDLKWQAEVAAKDQSMEAMQKELSKAEWWASLSTSPQLKDLVSLKSELSEEQERTLQLERKLNEAQASLTKGSTKAQSERLQANLNKEEARRLHLELALTRVQIEDERVRKAFTGMQVPSPSDEEMVTRDDLLGMKLQLQQLKSKLQDVEGEEKPLGGESWTPDATPRRQAPSDLIETGRRSRALSRMSYLRGRPDGLTDDSLRRRLATALGRALHDGSLSSHLDKARGVPRSQMRALRQEVMQLKRQLRLREDTGKMATSTQSALRIAETVKPRQKVQVNFAEADAVETIEAQRSPEPEALQTDSSESHQVLQDEVKRLMEEKERLASELKEEKADRLALDKELIAVRATQTSKSRAKLAEAQVANDQAETIGLIEGVQMVSKVTKVAKIEDEDPSPRHRTEEEKSERAVYLNELSAKESLLEKALEEMKTVQNEHLTEKEGWMKELAEQRTELRRLEMEKTRPLDLQEEVSEARSFKFAVEMQETVASDLRKQLFEAREELEVAESMQLNKALPGGEGTAKGGQESAMGQALRREQELAQHLHQELSEVETAAITTAEAAEARIIQIEAFDRRGRVSLHMAQTTAEKEAALKEDAIKAACEAEAQVEGLMKEVHRLHHEVSEQSQAVYRESAVCDGLRRALMNSVEEEMAQEALQQAVARPAASQSPSPKSPRGAPSAPPPDLPAPTPQLGRGTNTSFPRMAGANATAAFASRLANREDLKYDLMSPSEVKSWMAQDPSTISQPSLLSAAAKEAASLRKEAEQLRKEVRHWRASRPLRAEPTPPAGTIPTDPSDPASTASPIRPRIQEVRPKTASSAATSSQVPKLAEQPPPRPPLG